MPTPSEERWPYPFPSVLAWFRYHLTWKGWRAMLPRNPQYAGAADVDWKLHRCADGQQCRAEIGGGCAGDWCAHFEVKPYGGGYGDPRLPRRRIIPVRCRPTGEL